MRHVSGVSDHVDLGGGVGLYIVHERSTIQRMFSNEPELVSLLSEHLPVLVDMFPLFHSGIKASRTVYDGPLETRRSN